MIQIFKSKGLWYVRHIARNGKTLSISEGLKTKKNAFKNINATSDLYKIGEITILDDKED